MSLVNVNGHCLMGCGRTLHLNTGTGMIICVSKKCPRPTALSDLIAKDPEPHKVEVGWQGFAIKHPLHERIDDRLFECDLQKWLEDLEGPPVSDGFYSVVKVEGIGEHRRAALREQGSSVIDGWLFTASEEP